MLSSVAPHGNRGVDGHRQAGENRPIREIVETLGVAKSIIWYILKQKEAGELSRLPFRRWKWMDPKWMIVEFCLSMVTMNSFMTSSQVKNTLEEAGLALPKSPIKRRLHEWKYSQEQKAQISLCPKACPDLEQASLEHD